MDEVLRGLVCQVELGQGRRINIFLQVGELQDATLPVRVAMGCIFVGRLIIFVLKCWDGLPSSTTDGTCFLSNQKGFLEFLSSVSQRSRNMVIVPVTRCPLKTAIESLEFVFDSLAEVDMGTALENVVLLVSPSTSDKFFAAIKAAIPQIVDEARQRAGLVKDE